MKMVVYRIVARGYVAIRVWGTQIRNIERSKHASKGIQGNGCLLKLTLHDGPRIKTTLL